MSSYRLSKSAVEDIAGIAEYTIDRFGIEQARRYRDGMIQNFEMLAARPSLGHGAEDLVVNLKRWNYESHIIYYLPGESDVLIVRVLHQRMDTRRHVMRDD